MKTIIIIVVVLIAGFFIYQQMSQPPDPLKVRAKAQENAHSCIKYFLDSIINGRDADMLAVCAEAAYGQAESAVRAIHAEESRLGGTFDEYTCFAMGAEGAYRAALSSKKDGIILINLTIVAHKEDGKFVVFNISQD